MRSRPAAWPSASAGSTTCAPLRSTSALMRSGSPTMSCGTVAGLAQHVGAGADADEHRLVLLDERLERLQVLRRVRFLGDDHHMAAVQVDVDVGNADAVDQQRALAADELDGVARERLEVSDQAALGLVHQLVDLVVGALGAEGEPAVAGVHAAVVQPDPRAVLDLLEDLGAGVVDQGDAVVDQHLGPEVGVAAGDRRRGVDHGRDVGFDQGVRGDAVQVQRVDDHDVAGSDAPQEPIDVAVNPGGAGDARAWAGITG